MFISLIEGGVASKPVSLYSEKEGLSLCLLVPVKEMWLLNLSEGYVASKSVCLSEVGVASKPVSLSGVGVASIPVTMILRFFLLKLFV